MKNDIADILFKYTTGEATLEETNDALKEAEAGFNLEPGRTHAGGAGRHLREVPAGTALRGRGGTRPTHPGAERASAAGAHRGREAR